MQVSGGMGYGNGLGLDLAGKQSTTEHLHLEDFKFTDLKWAKSSRMSKRWLVFSLRVKVQTTNLTPFLLFCCVMFNTKRRPYSHPWLHCCHLCARLHHSSAFISFSLLFWPVG